MPSFATSSDGTTIAYDRLGDGRPLILVGGMLSDRRRVGPLPGALAGSLGDAWSVVTYDRRGRGDSGDTPPYAVDREIEDLVALIEATGGTADVYGHSSGAGLSAAGGGQRRADRSVDPVRAAVRRRRPGQSSPGPGASRRGRVGHRRRSPGRGDPRVPDRHRDAARGGRGAGGRSGHPRPGPDDALRPRGHGRRRRRERAGRPRGRDPDPDPGAHRRGQPAVLRRRGGAHRRAPRRWLDGRPGGPGPCGRAGGHRPGRRHVPRRRPPSRSPRPRARASPTRRSPRPTRGPRARGLGPAGCRSWRRPGPGSWPARRPGPGR